MIEERGKKMKISLEKKINSKQAKVGIVGLGYVGLPTAMKKIKEGFEVTGFDVSKDKVELINNGINYIGDVNDEELKKVVLGEKTLKATSDFTKIKEMDVIFICVPTPINEFKQPNLSFVDNASKNIAENVEKGALIILESTTYPGTTEEIVLPVFVDKGFKVGENIFIAYSPERIDPGNKTYGLDNTPKIVGGITNSCTSLAKKMIGDMAYEVSSTKVAEMSKVFENTFRYINIALVNETARICEKMDVDVWEMIEASGTKPYGFMPFQPGPGVGGHCIPVDPYYLTWKARELGETTKMIELSGQINDETSEYILTRTMKILNEEGKSLKGSKVAILGLAYKKNIDDLRESPILPIVEKIKKAGADVILCDPHVTNVKIKDEVHEINKNYEEVVERADIVLLTTDHSLFDYELIAKKSKLIFDTRNGFKHVKEMKAKYVKL